MKKFLLFSASAALLSSCATSPIAEVDIIKTWTSPNPAAARNFEFYNTNAFDVHLHRSLNAFHKVELDFSNLQYSPQNNPERLETWFRAIKDTGGQVRVCRIESGIGLLAVLKALTYAFGFYQEVRTYVTYTPASKFNANILVSAEQPNRIVKVEFVKRNISSQTNKECASY